MKTSTKLIFVINLIFYTIFTISAYATFAATPCNVSTGQVCIDNPLGDNTDPSILIGQVINAVMGIVGSLALVMFIYGGLTWMLAAGNNEKVQKGKDILVWATIGLVVIFSSYALVKFVFTGLGVPGT